MYLIVGLGNPGKKYENTRHNMGFLAVDYLANRWNISVKKIKHKALIGEGMVNGEKVLLAKPQTYMNLSGDSVRELVNYYKVEGDHLLVIYDDVDLDCGSVRIRPLGGAGTHNGMRSIVKQLGMGEFPRVRIGIGKNQFMDMANFVTGEFSKEEKKIFEKAIVHTGEAVETLVKEGINKAMNIYNGSY